MPCLHPQHLEQGAERCRAGTCRKVNEIGAMGSAYKGAKPCQNFIHDCIRNGFDTPTMTRTDV